jgi:hypothetical protein
MAHLIQHIRQDWMHSPHTHEVVVKFEHALLNKKFWITVGVSAGILGFLALMIFLARNAEPVNHPYFSPYMF